MKTLKREETSISAYTNREDIVEGKFKGLVTHVKVKGMGAIMLEKAAIVILMRPATYPPDTTTTIATRDNPDYAQLSLCGDSVICAAGLYAFWSRDLKIEDWLLIVNIPDWPFGLMEGTRVPISTVKPRRYENLPDVTSWELNGPLFVPKDRYRLALHRLEKGESLASIHGPGKALIIPISGKGELFSKSPEGVTESRLTSDFLMIETERDEAHWFFPVGESSSPLTYLSLELI